MRVKSSEAGVDQLLIRAERIDGSYRRADSRRDRHSAVSRPRGREGAHEVSDAAAAESLDHRRKDDRGNQYNGLRSRLEREQKRAGKQRLAARARPLERTHESENEDELVEPASLFQLWDSLYYPMNRDALRRR